MTVIVSNDAASHPATSYLISASKRSIFDCTSETTLAISSCAFWAASAKAFASSSFLTSASRVAANLSASAFFAAAVCWCVLIVPSSEMRLRRCFT